MLLHYTHLPAHNRVSPTPTNPPCPVVKCLGLCGVVCSHYTHPPPLPVGLINTQPHTPPTDNTHTPHHPNNTPYHGNKKERSVTHTHMGDAPKKHIKLSFFVLGRRRPTLPHTPVCSTIGAGELSFRVRKGTGRILTAINHRHNQHPTRRCKACCSRHCIVDANNQNIQSKHPCKQPPSPTDRRFRCVRRISTSHLNTHHYASSSGLSTP